ncbi:type III secretion protein [Burkholderia ubonensis]|uniref:HrpB1 family type III secretion system apparatus protein n=1 Tax=Burkholderia ubonensis TaxID=101571 RepID=UPI00075F495A|nr:HrpB1 family type III secretion system apparatus protein [Burkholderia ubonensis]KVP36384.1 type III secretion protein [Burkholderia ubonensis]KWB44587.1 type III secretion protein [Burkholderia ubonensis]
MVVDKHEYLNCSSDIIGGLIDIVSVSLFRDFPKVNVDLNDVEKVIGALVVLRPNVVEIETLTGLLHMFRGNWGEAIYVLRSVSERAPKFSYARTLLAVSLSMKGDSSWQRVAREAMELEQEPHTEALVKVMQAREDLHDAMQRQQNGGVFEIPPSCVALIGDENTGSVSNEETATVDPGSIGYLRL